MEIKLDENLKKEVIEQAKKQLLADVLAEFNTKQIAAEIKNSVTERAAEILSRQFAEAYKVNNVIDRAVQSAESRVQTQITKLLEKGITISFKAD